MYGKVPHIIAQGAELINPSHFAKVYNLSHERQCLKTLKVRKDLEEVEVEAFLVGLSTSTCNVVILSLSFV